MRVVIDSSAIIASSPSLDSTAFRTLFAAAEHLGMTLCIPALVIEEVAENLRAKLAKYQIEVDRTLRAYGAAAKAALDSPLSIELVEEHAATQRRTLEEAVSARSCLVIEYPDIEHDILARRAVAKRKPFGDSRDGYRDALIWYSVLSLLQTSVEPLVFVCANTKDFANQTKDANLTLHTDLADDIRALGLDPDVVKLVRSVNELNDLFVLPQLQQLEELEARLKSNPSDALWFLAELTITVNRFMTNTIDQGDPALLGFDDDVIAIEAHDVFEVSEIDQVKVRRLPSSQLLVDVQFSFEGEFKLLLDASSDLTWGFPDEEEDLSVTRWISRIYDASAQLIMTTEDNTIISSALRTIGYDYIETTAVGSTMDSLKRSLESADWNRQWFHRNLFG